MLTRVDSFSDHLRLNASAAGALEEPVCKAASRSAGMMHEKDYLALGAICLVHRPRRIFEIGTYRGVTSDFLLELLPECHVVSIAYLNTKWSLLRKKYNNSHLARGDVGSSVSSTRRNRFTQIFGDSHVLESDELIARHGRFDLVFIDGDHSYEGVRQDTELARRILTDGGVICWHDANPKDKYRDVARYLAEGIEGNVVATRDNYLGGIAYWHPGHRD